MQRKLLCLLLSLVLLFTAMPAPADGAPLPEEDDPAALFPVESNGPEPAREAPEKPEAENPAPGEDAPLALPPEADAPTAAEKCGDDLYWSFGSGKLTLTGSGDMYDYGAQKNFPWYGKRGSVKTIAFPDGMTCIRAHAFQGFTALTAVTVPESVEWIGDEAFSGCKAVKSVTLACSTPIGAKTFDGCSALNTVRMTKGTGMMQDYTWFLGVIVPTPWCQNYQNKSIAVTLDEGIANIGANAFNSCAALTSVSIPSTVASIGQNAFYWCTNLKTAALPAGLKSIGEDAFWACTGLTEANLPDSVETVGPGAFSNCSALAAVTLGSGLQRIDATAFSETAYWDAKPAGPVYQNGVLLGVKSPAPAAIAVTPGTRLIADGAFADHDDIESVALPNSVARIPYAAFLSCTALTAVSIPDGVETVDNLAFAGCAALASVVLPDSVTAIGPEAFADCALLASVRLPAALSEIPYRAFADCAALDSIALPDTVTRIGQQAFSGCSALVEVVLPSSLTTVITRAFSDCTALETLTIPRSVTTIEHAAFSNCPKLKDVYYLGTEAQRAETLTLKGAGHESLAAAEWHYLDDNGRYLEIDEAHFPDANFRAWIVENLPCIAEEGSVPFMTEEQVNSVTEIEIGGTFLTTAKGVELFPNLETLGVSGCGLTALDVTGIPSLVALFCNDTGSDEGDEELNQIAALDLSHNPLLEVLICDGNLLTELDLSHNPELVELNCGRNRITALDLSKNTKLRYLYCDENRLSVLDLSANNAIDEEYVTIVDQTLPQQVGKHANGTYTFDLAPIVGAANLANVRLNDVAHTMNAEGIVTFPSAVESFVYLYDTGHGLMDVTVPLTFEEVQPTAPSDVMSTAANFMGKMLVNYYIVMSEEALADKDAYVEIKLNDDVKKVLVRDADTDEKNGVLRHKFEMEVPSKCMRDDIVLKLHAGNGSLLPLTYKQETDVTEGFIYHMVDYLRGRQQNSTSETMRRLAYTAEWYGTACQLYFNHHVNQLTEAEIAAMNEALNDASIMTGLANYAPIEGGTLPAGITKRSNTVVFESDNTLRTYFYTANPGAYTFMMDDNEIHLSEWEAGKYNYDIPNIPGKELAKWHKVTATDGTNTYTYKTSALGYCYGRAANSSNVDMQNLAKTLYLYGKAAMAYFGVPDQPAPADTPADPAAPNEPVLPESLQGRDIQLPIVP